MLLEESCQHLLRTYLAWEKQRSTWRSLVFMRVEPPAILLAPTTTLMLSLMGASAALLGIEGVSTRDRKQQVIQ